MDKDKQLILYIVIIGLIFILWESNQDTRNRNNCEGMSNQECQDYMDIIDAVGAP